MKCMNCMESLTITANKFLGTLCSEIWMWLIWKVNTLHRSCLCYIIIFILLYIYFYIINKLAFNLHVNFTCIEVSWTNPHLFYRLKKREKDPQMCGTFVIQCFHRPFLRCNLGTVILYIQVIINVLVKMITDKSQLLCAPIVSCCEWGLT